MKLVRFRAYNDYDTEVLKKGDHYIKAELNEVPVFLRPGNELSLAVPARHVESMDMKDLSIISF